MAGTTRHLQPAGVSAKYAERSENLRSGALGPVCTGPAASRRSNAGVRAERV